MKAHKYWSLGAFITMIGTVYTGYKGLKSSHKYFALSSLLCMITVSYTHLIDVVTHSFTGVTNELSEMIEKLPKNEQKRILNAVRAFVG